ncbi:MAG: hypothetical protein V4547_18955 [Bacteroidota bacterium]
MEKIKANELRIGNFIFECATYEEFLDGTKTEITPQKIITITSILEDGVNAYAFYWNQYECIAYSSLIPIPLTEDWLLRFGSELGGNTKNYTTTEIGKIYSLGYINISIFDGSISVEVGVNDYFPVDIKYVHQLQNLYFALTGEELTIK